MECVLLLYRFISNLHLSSQLRTGSHLLLTETMNIYNKLENDWADGATCGWTWTVLHSQQLNIPVAETLLHRSLSRTRPSFLKEHCCPSFISSTQRSSGVHPMFLYPQRSLFVFLFDTQRLILDITYGLSSADASWWSNNARIDKPFVWGREEIVCDFHQCCFCALMWSKSWLKLFICKYSFDLPSNFRNKRKIGHRSIIT